MPGTMLAFHYDLKRAMWTADFMDRYAATLADWGYNAILYEVEDKLRFSRHPAIAHADAISANETRARTDALRRRGFQVIPLVQSLGHADYVLTKPGYEHLRESPEHESQYDPLSDEARELICELIDETIAAVQPESFFHLGGDETWNLGESEKCAPVTKKIGKGGLYLRHMRPIIEHVLRRGLRPILWADIALTHPEIVKEFPRELVWMDWDYWTGADRWNRLHIWGQKEELDWAAYQTTKDKGEVKPEFIEHLEKYAVDDRSAKDGSFIGFPYTAALREMGFDVIVAPTTRSWGDSMGIPLNADHLPNCFTGARRGRDAGLGACVTSWAVRHSHPLVSLPAAFAAAQGFGTNDPLDIPTLARAFTEQRYGIAAPEFADALRLAEVRVPWCESREMTPPDEAAEAVAARLDRVNGEPGGRAALIETVESAAADLAEAEALFADVRARAQRNAADLDYWLEGTRHTAFCAAFSLALLRDRPAVEGRTLRERLDAQRDETRRLFAADFPAVSVDKELAVRYAFHDSVLDKRTLRQA